MHPPTGGRGVEQQCAKRARTPCGARTSPHTAAATGRCEHPGQGVPADSAAQSHLGVQARRDFVSIGTSVIREGQPSTRLHVQAGPDKAAAAERRAAPWARWVSRRGLGALGALAPEGRARACMRVGRRVCAGELSFRDLPAGLRQPPAASPSRRALTLPLIPSLPVRACCRTTTPSWGLGGTRTRMSSRKVGAPRGAAADGGAGGGEITARAAGPAAVAVQPHQVEPAAG